MKYDVYFHYFKHLFAIVLLRSEARDLSALLFCCSLFDLLSHTFTIQSIYHMTLFINIVSNNASLISTNVTTNNAFRCKAS